VASGSTAIRQRPSPRARRDPLHGDADQQILALGVAAPQSGLLTTHVGLVDLDRPGQPLRPGRTSTERKRCSIAQAVWEEPISRERCRLSAEMPSLAAANCQQAVNQTVSGVRVRSKIVPAVTDVRRPQPEHSNRPYPAALTALL
jgi:hypothetical protein